jgi:hypothetical protein
MKKIFSSYKSLYGSLTRPLLNTQKVKFCHHKVEEKPCPSTFKKTDPSLCPYLNYQQFGYNLIRNQAPQFTGMAWWKDDFKKINLNDFKGKWVCLFFYPLDFTFVCPTEIVDFNNASEEFSKLSKTKFNDFRLPSYWMLC